MTKFIKHSPIFLAAAATQVSCKHLPSTIIDTKSKLNHFTQMVIKRLQIDRNKKYLRFSRQFLANHSLNAASLASEVIIILLTLHSQDRMLLLLRFKKETLPRQ